MTPEYNTLPGWFQRKEFGKKGAALGTDSRRRRGRHLIDSALQLVRSGTVGHDHNGALREPSPASCSSEGGPPFAVYHFHQARRSLMPAQEVARIGLSVTRDEIIFSMAETNGNIGLATLE